jgi:hypothetical protein
MGVAWVILSLLCFALDHWIGVAFLLVLIENQEAQSFA